MGIHSAMALINDVVEPENSRSHNISIEYFGGRLATGEQCNYRLFTSLPAAVNTQRLAELSTQRRVRQSVCVHHGSAVASLRPVARFAARPNPTNSIDGDAKRSQPSRG